MKHPIPFRSRYVKIIVTICTVLSGRRGFSQENNRLDYSNLDPWINQIQDNSKNKLC